MPYYIPDATAIYETAAFSKPITDLVEIQLIKQVYKSDTLYPQISLKVGDVISLHPLADVVDEKIVLLDIYKHPRVAPDLPAALQKLNFLRQRRRENSLARIEYLQKDVEALKKPLSMNIFYSPHQEEAYTSPFTGKTL